MDMYDFKKNICIVEIESSSFCNRKCSYCINHYIDRFSENKIMLESTFRKIIDELAEIGYNRMITFHRYNEPFFDKNEMILERIAYARGKLPEANLVTSTNSDYLDKIYLQKIRMSGLDSLYCQCQTENYSSISVEEIKENILKINKRIGSFKGKFILKRDSCVFMSIGSGFKSLTIQARDFNNTGFNRGGIVKGIVKEGLKGPCYQPLISFTIDYNGKVTMCSNTVSYHNKHADYIIGDVTENTLTEIYQGSRAVKLRKELLDGVRYEICRSCTCDYRKYAEQNYVI